MLALDGQLLLCHRRADRLWYPDVWDFPGGHIEAGETPAIALARELEEELGIRMTGSGRLLDQWLIGDGSGSLAEDISFISVPRWEGTVSNLAPDEHDDLGWFDVEEALRLRLPDPRYRPLLAALDLG